MSRIIKQYPYSEVLDDESCLKADSVQKIQLPLIRLVGLPLEEGVVYSSTTSTPNLLTINLQPKMYAKEDEKGIFVYLVRLQDGEETDEKSQEVIIDEEVFADNIFKAVEQEISFDESYYLKDILANNLLFAYTDNYLKQDTLLMNTYYSGFGVILSNSTVIGTVDKIKLQADSDLVLSYCVGNFDLNNIENCNVIFNTHGIWLHFFNLNMRKVICNNDYYCTYMVQAYSFEYSKSGNIFGDIQELPSLSDYSEGNEAEFLEQRTAFIEDLQTETDTIQKNSYLADLL